MSRLIVIRLFARSRSALMHCACRRIVKQATFSLPISSSNHPFVAQVEAEEFFKKSAIKFLTVCKI